MGFATVAELGEWLGYPVDPAETARAQLLVDIATADIQSHTRQTIERVVDDTVTMPGTWEPVLRLPERPVESVSAVTVDGVALVDGTDYVVVGDEVRRPAGFGGPGVVVVVTYTHGWTIVPDDVKGVCLALAARRWVNPEAVTATTVDDQQWNFGSAHSGLTLAEKATLSRYRRGVRAATVW